MNYGSGNDARAVMRSGICKLGQGETFFLPVSSVYCTWVLAVRTEYSLCCMNRNKAVIDLADVQ